MKSNSFYESTIRLLYRENKWHEGKELLDEGLTYYPTLSGMNELAGEYYYHIKAYDKARYHLELSIKDNNENVRSKQLLVNVEDETKNYSSAICYVNELLEVNPYWRGLWRRKIELFNKQGNYVEADRLLKRMNQIYPNDTLFRRDLCYNLEMGYINFRKKGNRKEAIRKLEELIEYKSDNPTYYIDLSNLLLQEGKTQQAYDVVSTGTMIFPNNTELITRRASLLIDQQRFGEAQVYLNSVLKTNNNSVVRKLLSDLLTEEAVAEKDRDPYLLYMKLYDSTKSDESLNFLINTSISRGYYQDALYYIKQAINRKGEKPELLYKLYIVNKQLGNSNKSYDILTKLYRLNPNDKDIADELSNYKLRLASDYIYDDNYEESLANLNFVIHNSSYTDVIESAWSKKYKCYYSLKDYNKAMDVLDSIKSIDPLYSKYLPQKADLLNLKGKTTEALDLLYSAIKDSIDSPISIKYRYSYEDIAIPYIKKLIEDGATKTAHIESLRLLDIDPSSIEGLQYAINTANLLNKNEEYEKLVNSAISLHPEDLSFTIKKGALYNKTGQYENAIYLLRPLLDSLSDNKSLIGAYSEESQLYATKLLKDKEPDSAMAVINNALIFDINNYDLKYTKGLIFEGQHNLDSAFVYQKLYKPDMYEEEEFKRHLNGLLYRNYKNELNFEYLQGRYGQEDRITSVATASYSLRKKYDMYTARLNYAGKYGGTKNDLGEEQEPGGTGVQGQLEWFHSFKNKWAFTVNGALANKYFPKVMVGGKIEREFKKEWTFDIHAAYRLLELYKKNYKWASSSDTIVVAEQNNWIFDKWSHDTRSLINCGVGASKTLNDFIISSKVDLYMLSSKAYVNGLLSMKYYPLNDGVTSINALAGIGTAPEASVIDNALPSSFNKTTSMVGLGGTYLLTKNITLGIMGTWYTYYSQLNYRTGPQINYNDYIRTEYKNLYNIYGQLCIHF